MIIYFYENIKHPVFPKRKINFWIRKTAENNNRNLGDVSYIFCDDDKILEVNKEYLKHDYYTDIITFDYSENATISGDIFISVDTVKSNSEKFNTDYKTELYRVIIHGILHLCGYKDKSPNDKKLMREKENESLSELYKILGDKK
jgi:rRNA maturation RNase YbeY